MRNKNLFCVRGFDSTSSLGGNFISINSELFYSVYLVPHYLAVSVIKHSFICYPDVENFLTLFLRHKKYLNIRNSVGLEVASMEFRY